VEQEKEERRVVGIERNEAGAPKKQEVANGRKEGCRPGFQQAKMKGGRASQIGQAARTAFVTVNRAE